MFFLFGLIALAFDHTNLAIMLSIGQVAYSIDLLKDSLTKGK